MDDIYKFLKQKFQDRNILIDDIVSRSGVSRTTVYRMMKGLIRPSPQVYDLLIEMLGLDRMEVREFDHYIALIDVDENQLLARNELQTMFFKSSAPLSGVEDIEFIVYGENKCILKYSEILRRIAEASVEPEFEVEVKIFKCADMKYLKPLFDLLGKTTIDSILAVEHLVSFSGNDKRGNVLTLKSIFPLMRFGGYTLYFTNEEYNSVVHEIIGELMLIKYSYCQNNAKTEKHLVLSFEENGLSDCHAVGEKSLYEFFEKKFSTVRQYYKNIPVEHNNLMRLHNTLFPLETNGKTCIIKANPCYIRIPLSVSEKMLEMYSDEDLQIAAAYFNGEGVFDIRAGFKGLQDGLDDRNQLSLKYEQIDLFTMDGLEKFAKEGRLSDHYPFLPPYSKDDVRSILEDIQRKNSDPDDKYRFYISKLPMRDDSLTFCAYERNGIMLEYFGRQDVNDPISSCVIQQDTIAKSVFDFVENYLPQSLAMSEAEAERFITYLIETYCM